MSKQILVIASLLLHLNSIAQTETRSAPANATFGRYGIDCSSGRGVCSFSAFGEGTRIATNARSWKVNANSIILEFRRNGLSAEDQIRIAGKPFDEIKESDRLVFVQQERLVIDKESLANLDLDHDFNIIEAGNYDMHIGGDKAKIIIQLKSSE